MQLADLFGAPLGVLSVLCPSRAIHASGFAGGFDSTYEVKKLQKQVKELEMENDLLKKLQAFLKQKNV